MALICLMVVAGATNLSATTYVVPEDRELVAKADVVTTGFMVSSRARKGSRGRIETVYRVQVGDVLKGSLAASGIDVVQLGGQMDGKALVVSGAPLFVKGRRALLFLSRTAAGEWTILDLGLGLFNTIVDRKGRSILVRGQGEGEEFGWGVDGRVWNERPRLETEFVRYVRDVAQGKPSQVDYETTWESTGPIRASSVIKSAAAASAYLSFVDFGGALPNGFARVGVFDKGASIVFRTNGTQNGFGAESVNSATRAAAAWTNAPGVNVRYSVSGTTSTSKNPFDSTYVIVFNDPNGDIGGSFTGSGVVATAFQGFDGTTNTHAGETFYNIFNADVVVQDGVGAAFGIASLDTAITHELGHTLGFRHSNEGVPSSSAAVMNSSLIAFGAVLQPWDLEAVIAAYGGGVLPVAPAITSFVATPASITAGASSTLSWVTTNATSVSISNGLGARPVVGSSVVSPTGTTTFTLTATGAGGTTATATATVTVTAAATLRRGDANGDSLLNSSDIFFLINRLFAGGPAPVGNGDANNDGVVNSSDIFFLINHIFAGGPAPAPLTSRKIETLSRRSFSGSVTIGNNRAVAGERVTVPVTVESSPGTQGVAFRVMFSPASAVKRASLRRAGVAALSIPLFEATPATDDSVAYVGFFPGSLATNGHVADLEIELNEDLTGGTLVNLSLDRSSAALSDASVSSVASAEDGSLTLRDGSIRILNSAGPRRVVE